MALDSENNLSTFPLKNFDRFISACKERNIGEVNITGTNTDPLLYKSIPKLVKALRDSINGVTVGIRTNGALAEKMIDQLKLFDKVSFSIHSTNPDVYRKIMGQGNVPNLSYLLPSLKRVKVNVVLCKENIENGDVFQTIEHLINSGVKTINLREPYGQPHVGDPMKSNGFISKETILGMPVYKIGNTKIVYWDVHYVEVESVNLYANGNVSEDYPITRGHDVTGNVSDQSHFPGGRIQEQWISLRRK